MKRLTLSFTVVGVTLTAAYLVHLYFSHFYYPSPEYTIAIDNRSSYKLRNVHVSLEPEGGFSCGILTDRNPFHYMHPQWPIPTAASISFTDDSGNAEFELKESLNLPTNFQGELRLSISKSNGQFSLVVSHSGAQPDPN